MTSRLAVFLSGGGRTLQNFAEVIARGELRAELACVVSSRAGVFGLERARTLGLPAVVVPRKEVVDLAEFSRRCFAVAREHRADWVLLAGFLALLQIPADFRGKVLNIHPALLPSFGGHGFYGDRVHAAVLAAGVKVTGVSVHFADDRYDQGPILLQRCVPVRDDDTVESLGHRVFEEECRAYPEAVRLVLSGRVRIEGQRTWVHEA
jgi:phosphoribosylglycinamide formyltransferase-1